MRLLLILFIATVLRVVPIVYFSTIESIMSYPPLLKLTDIDYKVYTDAALLYTSPYQKHTYRYTPFIAYAMKFNDKCEYAGKLIFVIGDLLAIIFLWKLTAGKKHQSFLTKFYAYNPFFIYITIRGSCQSFGMALMYCFLWLWYGDKENEGNSQQLLVMDGRAKHIYSKQRKERVSGFRQLTSYAVFGLWVHYRVYPIIFIPYLLFEIKRTMPADSFREVLARWAKFGLVSGSVFLLLGYYFYQKYGYKFIEQTYLHHLSRRDNRHSFSPFFYQIYLNLSVQTLMRTMMRIIPQVYLLAVISQKLRLSPFAKIFLLTYSFVCFNRVITMQYYMWVWATFILVLPESEILHRNQVRKGFSLFMQWILGVSLWIWLSMGLEGKGDNVFTLMWACCLIKMFSELWVLSSFLNSMKTYRKITSQSPVQPPKPISNGDKSKRH